MINICLMNYWHLIHTECQQFTLERITLCVDFHLLSLLTQRWHSWARACILAAATYWHNLYKWIGIQIHNRTAYAMSDGIWFVVCCILVFILWLSFIIWLSFNDCRINIIQRNQRSQHNSSTMKGLELCVMQIPEPLTLHEFNILDNCLWVRIIQIPCVCVLSATQSYLKSSII